MSGPYQTHGGASLTSVSQWQAAQTRYITDLACSWSPSENTQPGAQVLTQPGTDEANLHFGTENSEEWAGDFLEAGRRKPQRRGQVGYHCDKGSEPMCSKQTPACSSRKPSLIRCHLI